MNSVRALVVLLGWAVLPGIAVGIVSVRPAEDLEDQFDRFLAVSLAAAFFCWTLAARAVASSGALTDTTAWIGVGIGGAALVMIAVVRRDSVRRLAGDGAGRLAAWTALWLVPTVPIVRWIVADHATFVNPTPWYYTDLVRQTVVAHGTPQWSFEWGMRVPFLDDYPGFTAGTAIAHSVTTGASTAAEHIITIGVVLATALAVALLVRVLGGSRFGAAVAVAVLMVSTVFAAKLLAIRPEAMGYPLMLLVPVLAMDFVRSRRRVDLVALGFAFASLAQIHGIDLTVSMILTIAGMLALVAADRVGSGAVSWGRIGAVLGVMAGAWLAVGGLWGGGFSGVTKVSGLPGIVDGVDPTYRFNALVTRMGDLGTPPSSWSLASVSLRAGLVGLRWGWSFVLLMGAIVAIVKTRHAVARVTIRRLGAFLGFAMVGLFVVSAALTLRWDTYVPRRTGLDRMLHLWPVLLAVVVGWAAGSVVRATHGRARALAVTITVAGAVVLALVAAGPLASVASQHPPADQSDVLRRFDIPDDALVLSNAYTESYPVFMAGLHPVLNGRAPYTERKLLARANSLVSSARQFFSSNAGPLPCTGIDYVVAQVVSGWYLGTDNVFGTDVQQLLDNPSLQLVAYDGGVMVFAVRPGAPARRLLCERPTS
jgi:hypothetical protein